MAITDNDKVVTIPDGLEDGTVLCYDISNNRFIDSGVKAKYGSVFMDSGALLLGAHEVSGSGENIVFKNTSTDKIYYPSWKEVDPTGKEERPMTSRKFTSELREASIGSTLTSVLTNPDFKTQVSSKSTVFQAEVIFIQAYTNVIVEIFYGDTGKQFWKSVIPHVSTGKQKVQLEVPVDVYPGELRFKIFLASGEPIELRGDREGHPYLSFFYRTFEEEPLATEAYVQSHVGSGSGDMLKSVYDTDDDGKVNLAVAADRAATLTGVQGIGNSYYYGKDADGNAGFHPLPTTTGNIDFSKLTQGDVPLWDAANNVMIPSGIRKVAGQTLAEPSGIYLGDVSVSSDGHGILISPVDDPKTYKILTQAITANKDEAFIRAYGNPQEKDIHTGITDQIKDPTVSFVADKDATIVSMDVHSSEVLRELLITFRNTNGEAIWAESFFDLEAGENTLTLATPPDVISGETVTLTFSGKSHSNDYIMMDGTGSTPYLKLNMMQWTEKKIATEEYVTSGVGGLETKVHDAEEDLDNLDVKTEALAKRLSEVHNYFVYRGKDAPTFPVSINAGYFGSLYALTKRIEITLPNPAGAHDGTHFFLRNEDKNNSVRLEAPTGGTIKGGTAINVPPQNTIWLVRKGDDWLELLSGYLPTSYNAFLSDIKSYLATDATFLKALGIQNDDPNSAPLEVKSLEFHQCDVEHDPNDASRAIINPRLGVDFINPDNSRINKVTAVKLVGMEIKATTDGTPPKLILLDHSNVPQPSTASAYAFFDASATPPDSVAFQSLPVFRGGRVTVHKDTTAPEYAYIMIPPGEATDAERIGELGGMPSYWSKQSKVYTIGGQQRTYTVFRSPYKFHETDVTLVIYP